MFIFKLRQTSLPDVYELYCQGTNNSIEKHSYASIPNLKTSKYLRKIFKNKKINNIDELSSESEISDLESCDDIIMKCKYHQNFKKWIPYKEVINKEIDNINLINNIEINLNNNKNFIL